MATGSYLAVAPCFVPYGWPSSYRPDMFASTVTTVLFSSLGYGGRRTSSERHIFKAEDPIDLDDLRRGFICSKSGYWFPAHEKVVVNGRKYGRRYAPDIPRNERL